MESGSQRPGCLDSPAGRERGTVEGGKMTRGADTGIKAGQRKTGLETISKP